MPSTSASISGLVRLTAIAALCAFAALLAIPPQPRALATPLVNEDDDYIVSDDADVSGDTVEDTIVAQPDGTGGDGNEPGRVEVRSGQDDAILVTLVGKYDGDKFGHSAAIAGDLNLDGLDDLIVGAPADGFGAAYVFFGPFDATRPPEISAHSADYWFTSIYEDDFEFGDDVGRIFDHDDDGISDLRVAAKWTAPDGTDHTRTYIYSGISGQILHVLHGEIAEVIWNTLIGDVNEDGIVDMFDLYQIQLLFGTVDATMTQRDGDLNLDGVIDTADYAIASANLGTYDEQYAAAGTSAGLITVQEGNCTVTYQQLADGTLKWKGASCVHCSGGGCNGDDGDGGDGGDGGSGGSGGDGGDGGSGSDGGEPGDPAPPCLSANPHPEYACVGSDVPVTVNYDTDRPCPIEWPPLPDGVACYLGSDGECIPPGIPVTGQSQTIQFLGPGSVSIRPTACGCTVDEPIEITATGIDLRIDSNNDGVINEADNAVEDQGIGLVTGFRHTDADGDFIHDIFDGYDCDPANPDDDLNANARFDRVILKLGDNCDPNIEVRFDFPDDPPGQSTRDGFRLWTKNGGIARDKRSVLDGGDYVQAGSEIPRDLLPTNSDGDIELWLEAMADSSAPGDMVITVTVEGASDSVRFTSAFWTLTRLESQQQENGCNYIQQNPDGTIEYQCGGTGEPFMMVGARDDTRLYLGCEWKVMPDDPALREFALFGIAKLDEKHNPIPGVTQIDLMDLGDRHSATIRSHAPTVAEALLYWNHLKGHVPVIGIDTNGDGVLQVGEVRNSFFQDFRFHPATPTWVDAAYLALWLGSGPSINNPDERVAARFARAFLGGEILMDGPPDEESLAIEVESAISAVDPLLESAVGAEWDANCLATIPGYQLPATSEAAEGIARSVRIKAAATHSFSIEEAEIVESLRALLGQGIDPSLHPGYWIDLDVDAYLEDGQFVFDEFNDAVYKAFGKAFLDNPRIRFTLAEKLDDIDGDGAPDVVPGVYVVTSCVLEGVLHDLYDWDHSIEIVDDDPNTPNVPALDARMAIVQTAYPTIPANEPHGGRIFRSRVTLDTPIPGLTYEFDTN